VLAAGCNQQKGAFLHNKLITAQRNKLITAQQENKEQYGKNAG
jgi:hypothetical protein